MSNSLLVGSDVHRKSNTYQFMDSAGRLLAPCLTLDNNRLGTEAFVSKLLHLANTGDFDSIRIACEATNYYWWHLFQTLDQHPLMKGLSVELFPLNPRLTHNFKKTYIDADHNDINDAFVIADRLRLGRDLPPAFHYEGRYFRLRLLTRYRCHLALELAREKSYCLALLYLKFSDYSRSKPFADLFGAASRSVIEQFASVEEVSAISFDKLTQFVDSRGRRRFSDPKLNAERLKQMAESSYRLPEELCESINLVLGLSLKYITQLEDQLKRLQVGIQQQMQSIAHSLQTIPGLGLILSAGIIAEIAGIQRFNFDQAKVAKYAGLKWNREQSGDYKAEDSRLTRTGNRYLRYYLCEAANIVRMHDEEYAKYYERKYSEVRHHQHKRAMVLTARKLVRLVVRLLTTNQAYRPRNRQSHIEAAG